jgi:hypothetical protein
MPGFHRGSGLTRGIPPQGTRHGEPSHARISRAATAAQQVHHACANLALTHPLQAMPLHCGRLVSAHGLALAVHRPRSDLLGGHTSDLWNPRAIYITENGCSSADFPNADRRIEDTDRVMLPRNYLTHLQRPDGYSKRFGLHYADFKTGKRPCKLSADWYRQVIRRNTVA